MIPDRVAEHLQGPSFIQVATRNADLRPGHAHVVGAVVHDDRVTVTFFVHETRAKRIVDDLEQNGRVALEAAQASHEAYQLKGRYVSSRPSSEEEYAVQESYKNRIVEGLMQFFPEELAKPIAGVESEYRPSIAITFRVEEVFLQTPGPGAGTKMET